MIKRRIKRKLRSLVGCYGPQQVGNVWRATEEASKGLIVFCDGRDAGDSCIETRLAHFARIDHRLRRLLLECPYTAGCTASAMASASRKSFFCPFEYSFLPQESGPPDLASAIQRYPLR
jgi:hypothetical protein